MKLKKDTNQVADFASEISNHYDPSIYIESDFFKWIEYKQEREEYKENEVLKSKWKLIIDNEYYGDLETLKIGSIIDFTKKCILPKIDFGEISPIFFVYDFELGEWKSPTYQGGVVNRWDVDTKQYVPII